MPKMLIFVLAFRSSIGYFLSLFMCLNGYAQTDKNNTLANSLQNLETQRQLEQKQGVERLNAFKWKVGYVLPQYYRGDHYKTNYIRSNLDKPQSMQQWYHIRQNYILTNEACKIIMIK